MSEIVERLRALEAWIRKPEDGTYNMNTDMFDEAADEITRLRNELHIAQVWSERVIAGHEQDITEITRLRAENERLRAALTPSAETKAAYIGEFHFTEEGYDEDGQVYYRKVAVPWTIIKEIMAAISARAALDGQPAPGKEDA